MFTSPLPLAPAVRALREGALDPRDVVDEVCDRIDRSEPVLEALIDEPGRRRRLLADADRLLERHPEPGRRPALFGVLVGVKDIFEAEGFVTRGGTTVPPHVWSMPEAACVTALRDAGALVLGKTVTTEFAFYEPGPTRNPHDPAHTPGGSSSGSAVAVAAGYCHLALGSQTIGSMIRPAAFCGIVGSKPTFGRVPTSGVLPFSESADTVGVFTQDVSGNALALAVVTDGWRSAGGWSTADGRRSADGGASRAGANTSADRPVLGVPEGPYLEQAPDATRDAFEGHVAALEGAGYQVRRVRLFDDIEEVNVRHRRMAAAEMAAAHAEWFAQYGSRYRPRTAEFLRLGQTVGAAELAAARAGRAKLRDEIEAAAAAAGVDVWLSPSAPGPAPEGLASTGDPIMNLPWTHAGLPTLTVPAASPFELPLGLQLSAGWMRDEPLFEWAGPIAAVVGPG